MIIVVNPRADSHTRIPKKLQTPDSGRHCHLPHTPRLCSLLETCDGEPLLRIDKQKPRKSDMASLLLYVEPGAAFNGLLTPWGEQEFTHWAYHQQPWDAFSLVIKQVIVLKPWMKLHIPEASKRAQLSLSSVTIPAGTEMRLPAKKGAGEQISHEQARALLHINAADWEMTNMPMLCLAVPAPIAHSHGIRFLEVLCLESILAGRVATSSVEDLLCEFGHS